MSCLHTVSQSPSVQLLKSCCQTLNDGDAILFIEDGVYHIRDHSHFDNISKGISLFSLREDMIARGLQDDSNSRVKPIGYRGFVELCTEYDKVVSWF